ncbi:MAG: T9SS type A sorting domain-containing protein, partial [Calditrichaeota bacterium]|nr:T9SS type A sorting domain-containing protein [Calditrichota bacterium]
DGDLILAYSSTGTLVGGGAVSDSRCGLAIWGDDETTEALDGLKENDIIELRLRSIETNSEFLIDVSTIQTGSMAYQTDQFTVINVELKPALPDNYFLSGAYPNPFNNLTRLTYGMPESGFVKVDVFDISGRLVETLVNENLQAGYHNITWNAGGISTGIYLVKMNTDKFSSVKKLMLVK